MGGKDNFCRYENVCVNYDRMWCEVQVETAKIIYLQKMTKI